MPIAIFATITLLAVHLASQMVVAATAALAMNRHSAPNDERKIYQIL